MMHRIKNSKPKSQRRRSRASIAAAGLLVVGLIAALVSCGTGQAGAASASTSGAPRIHIAQPTSGPMEIWDVTYSDGTISMMAIRDGVRVAYCATNVAGVELGFRPWYDGTYHVDFGGPAADFAWWSTYYYVNGVPYRYLYDDYGNRIGWCEVDRPEGVAFQTFIGSVRANIFFG